MPANLLAFALTSRGTLVSVSGRARTSFATLRSCAAGRAGTALIPGWSRGSLPLPATGRPGLVLARSHGSVVIVVIVCGELVDDRGADLSTDENTSYDECDEEQGEHEEKGEGECFDEKNGDRSLR